MSSFLANILLALAWMALTDSFHAGGFFAGFIFGFVVIWIGRRDRSTADYHRRLLAIAGFIPYFIKEMVVANLRVAYDVLTPRDYMKPGIVAVPLDLETDLQITLLATCVTLTPGTLSLHISKDRKTLYVHAMYIDDPAALVQEIKQGFEQRIREIIQ